MAGGRVVGLAEAVLEDVVGALLRQGLQACAACGALGRAEDVRGRAPAREARQDLALLVGGLAVLLGERGEDVYGGGVRNGAVGPVRAVVGREGGGVYAPCAASLSASAASKASARRCARCAFSSL